MTATLKLLDTFKARMHISHGSEDDNLLELLSLSIADITQKCGVFDIETNLQARELVFERTRYAYNDSIEFFNENFLSQINSVGFANITYEDGAL